MEIEVQPPPTSKPQTLTKTESIPSQKAAVKVEKKAKGRKITTHDQANAIARGLLKAHDENIVRFRSNTYWKTQDVIYLLRKGHNRQYAAKRARVPQALIEKLLTLGGLPPAQSQVSVK
ncbi:hypothetical protein [Acaryochloris sp. CCMEE 5410]|uniref:hypothetical protein n=1 Tax=Acaryochloris sp. CCMEE 5410 TaxID=310037 RepID=UPI0021D1B2B7|nr:hypothetical protein [Acaryochloris sp. CCMEE 5410]KAI9130159.1 hypothetical protein ON05_031525 [Acaryochloris sp. CCMEE 5410]